MITITAVDPPGCGCTECLTGQYAPLDQATAQDIAALLSGQVSNHTSVDLRVTVTYTLAADRAIGASNPEAVCVEYAGTVWVLEPSDIVRDHGREGFTSPS
ncbi:hypothetical protein ABT160_45500 [Streptomyces sp. NPDC001941]|uniref:hypothetical protein n=1 Tax=Streptomyces sp. NPDC001941 TaxID=3154659 RepID=UPI0033338FCB